MNTFYLQRLAIAFENFSFHTLFEKFPATCLLTIYKIFIVFLPPFLLIYYTTSPDIGNTTIEN